MAKTYGTRLFGSSIGVLVMLFVALLWAGFRDDYVMLILLLAAGVLQMWNVHVLGNLRLL